MSEATRTRTSARGFTLLEVMAAMVIFLVGVVGVLGLFTSGLAMHREATQRSTVAQAVELVRARVAEALADLPAGDEPELPVLRKVPLPEYPNYFFTVLNMQVDQNRGIAGGVLAEVKVFTVDVGKEKGETFTLFVRPRSHLAAWIRGARQGNGNENEETGR